MGSGEQGLALLADGVSNFGASSNGPLFLTMLADAFRIVGQPDAGLARLNEAERQVEATQVRWWQSEVLRLRGALLMLIGDHIAAEANFRDAIAAARRQRAKFFELRVALDLVRHLHHQGRPGEARDLLGPLYGSFTEGFDTPDLKEAKLLIHGPAHEQRQA